MIKIAPEISLVITTYNSPAFLELVLKSVLRQHVFPLEVIIADDGSGEETRQLIDRYRKIMPVPLIHSWIPDEGFRLSKSRNVAIVKAKGSYIVNIDGDMVLMPHFIEDHRSLMKENQFVAGSRARLKEKEKIMQYTLSIPYWYWTKYQSAVRQGKACSFAPVKLSRREQIPVMECEYDEAGFHQMNFQDQTGMGIIL